MKTTIFLLVAFALTSEANANLELVALELVVENDVIFQQDRHYTHGMQLGLVLGEGPTTYQWVLGQSVFTPEDIDEPAFQAKERPWAGHLSFALNVRRNEVQALDTWRTDDFLRFELGQVGPASRVQWSQEKAHKITGSTFPEGWSHQLGNEATALAYYQKNWFYDLSERLQVVPDIGVSLGSPYTFVGSGFAMRWGRWEKDGIASSRIFPGYQSLSSAIHSTYWNYQIFAGAQYRWVYYNLFLDGLLTSSSHSVDRSDGVLDIFFGSAMSKKGYVFNLSANYRSPEFDGQQKGDWFASAGLVVPFGH